MRRLEANTQDWPSSVQYTGAFTDIRDQVTVNQLLMLQRHYHAPGRAITARRLAEQIGYANYSGVNIQYGTLAKRLCEALDVEVAGDHVVVLAMFVRDPSVEDGECQFIMRPQVARALAVLGWVW